MTPAQQAQYIRDLAAECGLTVEQWVERFTALTPEEIRRPLAKLAKPARAELFDIGPDGIGFVRLYDRRRRVICVLPVRVPGKERAE